jgi:hypothetical protein
MSRNTIEISLDLDEAEDANKILSMIPQTFQKSAIDIMRGIALGAILANETNRSTENKTA